MDRSPNLRLEIHGESPSTVAEPGRSYALQLVLRESNDGRWGLASTADGCMLGFGGPFTAALLRLASSGGYVVESLSIPGTSTRSPGGSPEDVQRVLASLSDCATIPYPITLWLSRVGDVAPGKAIRQTLSAPEKMDLFDDALNAGGIWISVADVFLDLVCSGACATQVLGWIEAAEMESGTALVWMLCPPE